MAGEKYSLGDESILLRVFDQLSYRRRNILGLRGMAVPTRQTIAQKRHRNTVLTQILRDRRSDAITVVGQVPKTAVNKNQQSRLGAGLRRQVQIETTAPLSLGRTAIGYFFNDHRAA